MDPLIRLTTGILLVPHGAQKLFGWFGGGGIAGLAAFLDKMSSGPGWFWAGVLGLLEFCGGRRWRWGSSRDRSRFWCSSS